MVRATAKVNVDMSSVTGDPLARKKVGRTKFKVYSDREKIKTGATVDNSSLSAEEPLVPARRKSTTVNRDTNGTDMNDVKAGPKNMANIKGLRDSSIKINVRRKALADVSNVRKIATSEVICDGSKPMKYKCSIISSIQRDSMDPGVKTANTLTRRSTMAQTKGKQSQHTGEPFSLKRGVKESVALSNASRTKIKEPCGRPAYTDKRRTQTNSLPLARKSLPVLRRNNQENSENSDKGKIRIAVPIKSKSGNKVIPRVSNIRSRITKSRASDGHIMVRKGQTNGGAHASSEKPSTTRPGKNVPVAPNTRTVTKTKLMPTADKSTSAFAISSGDDKSEKIPVPEDTTSTFSREDKNHKILSGGKNHKILSGGTGVLEENNSNVNPKRKAGRRRSYTSLLMARSKFLGEHGEVVEQEKIPNIDDGGNQLEVAEYVDEIYEYYWIAEAQFPSLTNYMSIQSDITPLMRGILINWLIEVHHKFDLMHETLYLMVTLLDRYLSQVPIQKNEMQLAGLTALLLASKYEDFWHPRIKDLISISAESYTREQMLRMESSILKKLKFRLNVPTPYVFMLRFLKAAQSHKVLEHLSFYLIELCLVEYEALEFKSSLLCASAIYLARLTLQISPAWTPLLVKHARYEVPQMRECARMILRFHKAAAGKGQLKVTCEKYSAPDLSSVAMMKPLENLPA